MNNTSRGVWGVLGAPFRITGKALRACWRWYKGQFAGRPWWYKCITAVWSFVAFVIFYCFAVVFNLFWLFGKSPSTSDILNPKTAAASEIYSADGKLLGKFFNENRSPVPYDSINPVFFQALIATEDERFYQHHGIDYQGLFAAVKDATQGKARGASTITQQLVKNMFRVRTHYSTGLLGKIPGVGILVMKSKEMIIATEIEMLCSKQEILEMYANTVDFGSNAFGIKTAAKTYFNTTPQKLCGFNVIETVHCPHVVEDDGRICFYILAGNRDGYVYASDIVDGRIVQPERTWSAEYQMLAVWGGKMIYPECVCVAYWTFDTQE